MFDPQCLLGKHSCNVRCVGPASALHEAIGTIVGTLTVNQETQDETGRTPISLCLGDRPLCYIHPPLRSATDNTVEIRIELL